MKTKLFYLSLFTLSIFLQNCSSEPKEKEITQREKFEKFIKGEATFFNTFNVRNYDDKEISGKIVKVEPLMELNRWSKNYHEGGLIVHLEDGQKIDISFGLNDEYYRVLKEGVMYRDGFYIEAFIQENNKSALYMHYDLNHLKYAAEFYKNGKKKKDLGKCTLDPKDYSYNRFIGKIKNTKKSRVYTTVHFRYYEKSLDLIYLENGEVLCMSAAYRLCVLKKDCPTEGQIINYISSDMDGEWNLCNVYDFEVENYL